MLCCLANIKGIISRDFSGIFRQILHLKFSIAYQMFLGDQPCDSNCGCITLVIRGIDLRTNVLTLCVSYICFGCFSVASEQLFDRRRCELLPDTQPTLEPITTAFHPLAAVATYS